MNKKLTSLLALGTVSALMLTGCGHSASYESKTTSYDTAGHTGYEEAEDYYLAEDAADTADTAANGWSGSGDAGYRESPAEEVSGTSASTQKMIITWNLSIDTENYQDVLQRLHSSISAAGGYIENESESMYGDDTHYCNLVIRIPASQIDSWMNGVDEYGTITYRSQSQENATLRFVDMESRLTSLRAEQEALLKLMERAESMEDIIAIQSQLTNVNYEIEYYESQLRTLTNTVDYATIYLDLREVSHETPNSMTFGEEIVERFTSSTRALGNFLRNLLIGILGNSVIIILAAACILLPIHLIRKSVQKRKAKRCAAAAAAQATDKTSPKEPLNE